jgi:hypothetical protein
LRKKRNFRSPAIRKSGLGGLPPFEQAWKRALFLLSRTFPDEIGYTPIEKREANLFFNMTSELSEKVSVIVTSNKNSETWAEIMAIAS